MKSIRSTQIARLDGLMLCASVDDEHQEGDVVEIKNQIRAVLRKQPSTTSSRTTSSSSQLQTGSTRAT
ncbi:hypothetical protein HYQ44_005177 [Verticillium longisporum]|nr:hypothetical protein HYQ44_005177 [Verticillium longisporum]